MDHILYQIDHILYQIFKTILSIFKKYDEIIDNPSLKKYINKIENRINI